MREVLLEGEGWNKQGGSVWIGRGGGFSAVTTPSGDVPGESEASEVQIDRWKKSTQMHYWNYVNVVLKDSHFTQHCFHSKLWIFGT